MRRLIVAVVVVVGLVAAGPAPARAQEGGLFDDGACTLVPDQLPGIFDFTEACQAHDDCYAQGEDRAACDQAFRLAMQQLCAAQHLEALDPGRLLCLTFAELYFFGVRLFGGFFFE